jgi:hypothetical protein
MDGPPAADPRPSVARLLVGIHVAFLAVLVATAVPLIAQPCDGGIVPGCDAFLGLYALGLALIVATCLAIRALFGRPSPLVIVDAFVGAAFAPFVVAPRPLPFFDPLVVLAFIGIAIFAIASLIAAASDVADHAVERWVAIAGLIGIAVLFGTSRTSEMTIAVLVPVLGVLVVVVSVAVSGRRTLRAGRPPVAGQAEPPG